MNSDDHTQDVVIKEYKTKTIKDLSPDEISYLKKECFHKSRNVKSFEIDDMRIDGPRIKNDSFSGVIQLDDHRIHFAPKVSANLLYMLSFLKDDKNFYYDPSLLIDIDAGENFFDILGRLFINELDSIFQIGFFKKYVRKSENTPYLKGKLMFTQQIQNDIRKRLKFASSYEDLTYDNIENQIILRATNLLIPLIRFNEGVRQKLHLYNQLLREKVSLVKILPEECNRVQYSKLNDYYQAAIQFSKVIIQHNYIRSLDSGASIGFNFVVDMNKVFEDFITDIITEIVQEDEKLEDFYVVSQKSFKDLLKEKTLDTRPDVIIGMRHSEDFPIVIDTKYKPKSTSADYYQVIAYSLAIPTAKSCYLVYPKYKDSKDNSYTVNTESFGNERPEIKLNIVCIDLMLEGTMSFDEFVSQTKNQLREKILNWL